MKFFTRSTALAVASPIPAILACLLYLYTDQKSKHDYTDQKSKHAEWMMINTCIWTVAASLLLLTTAALDATGKLKID